MALQVKSLIEPELVDVLANFKLDIFASMNCVKIGSIQSFDGTKKTATVQILFKRTLLDGTVQSYPVLIDVPVFTLQGGGGSLQFPITKGDTCLLLFSDRGIDEWLQNGTEAAPLNARMHDLSDAIALVGLNPVTSALPVYPTNKIVMAYQGTSLEITATGYTLIAHGGGELDIGTTCDLKASAGGEIELDALVSIKNNSTTLLIVLTNLLTVLEALTVVVSGSSGVVSPATIAALVVVQTQLNTLLE